MSTSRNRSNFSERLLKQVYISKHVSTSRIDCLTLLEYNYVFFLSLIETNKIVVSRSFLRLALNVLTAYLPTSDKHVNKQR